MVPTELSTDLARFQFAFTAAYHFLFVPLTLGMSWMLVIMEAAYLKTGKQVYKDMTRFWGKLFAINFAMGVVTGITMEFEFGLNWAYFSRMIGDTFGTALAIEGITAFMTEATMFGLFFFTWDKVSKRTHFLITLVMAIGTNLSILNILVANSWMQNPVATHLDYHTMTMKITSFVGLYMQNLAQIRFGHVAFGAFMLSAMFVLGISAFYLRKKQDVNFALRSIAVALGFGLASGVFAFFLGDANGLAVAIHEPVKMAAIEGQWTTQKAPAAWVPIAMPDQATETNKDVWFKVPYALSLIAGHNLTTTVEGLKPIMLANRTKIKDGAKAYAALELLREGKGTKADIATFDQYRNVIGYGMLLLPYNAHPTTATHAQIVKASKDSIPYVAVPFWAFRGMLAFWGVVFIAMLLGVYYLIRHTLTEHRWFLWLLPWLIPLPYLAAECGWFLAEIGRQPWVIKGILPTAFGASSESWQTVAFSVGGFALFYTLLLVVELYLMFTIGRKGPSTLGTGSYHFESVKKGQ
jgi:cytochrome bd ubiquinol oxidase subunit I